MAGTLQRAGGQVLRRATAAGLSGLAFALFVGVMAFAFTTSPAGHPEESAARYLATASRMVDLKVSVPRAEAAVSAVASLVPGSDRAFELSRADLTPVPGDHLDLMLARALEDARDEERSALASMIDTALVPAIDPALLVPTVPEAELAGIDPEPDLVPGDRVPATISFYYCEHGVLGLHPGDGGGFCGAMRDGTVVYPGAAACAYGYLGQRFRILGDPLERVYVCADTGSAVHGLHRDVWFMDSDEGWTWQLKVGQVAMIEILP